MPPMMSSNNSCHSRIKKLPPLLINQLAAGEIVTRPASVVKELLENAIDAGATQIEIKVTQGGMGMIEVSDNGCGIHPDDMVMAVTRHATSKVADVANLQGITTLGFRGEALASTAAVSRLTLSSSHDDSGIGRQLSVAGILEESPILAPIVHSQGTTVLVKDLYFNVPARRGNLKSVATEFAHIESVVREVAVAYADISLTLYHEQKKRLVLLASEAQADNEVLNADLLGDSDKVGRLPLSRLEQALGMSLTAQSVPLIVDLAGLLESQCESTSAPVTVDDSLTYGSESQILGNPQIEGWLWTAQQYQSPPSLPKLIYVNGRLIKDQIIASQLRQTIQSAATAVCGYALYFQLPTHWLNVNVHPSKQRIKIHALANIMAHLDYAIKAKLGVFNSKRIQSNSSTSYSDNPLVSDQRQVKERTQAYRTAKSSANSLSNTSQVHGQLTDSNDFSSTSFNNNLGSMNNLVQRHEQDHLANIDKAIVSARPSPTALSKSQGLDDLPRLLKVITKRPDNSGSVDHDFIEYSVDTPLLLLYWRDQHFVISYQEFLKLLLQEDDKKVVEIDSGQDAIAIRHQYNDCISGISNDEAARSQLIDSLNQYSMAVLGIEQLLQIMLNNLIEPSGNRNDS